MKLSTVLLTMIVTTAQAEREISTNNQSRIRKLLSRAQRRRLGDDDDPYDEEFSAEGTAEVEEKLMDYSLKLLKCQGDETLGSKDDNGNLQYGVAIVRACPKNSCSSSKQGGCTSGHADFAVPLGDFVEAYMDDQADNMNWDDQMNDVANWAQCAQYEYQPDDDGANAASYYVGPTCTSNGKDVMLGLFEDASCSQPANSKKFQEISNGWTLPFSTGGLVSYKCLDCGYKGDDGVTYLKDMCAGIYEDAALHCEDWDISHYYWDSITEVYRFGKDTTGCKRIGWMDKTPEPFGEWASIFGLALLVMGSMAGAVWYTLWWKKQKQNLEKIDDEEELGDEDPDVDYQAHEGDEHEEEESEPSALMGWFS